MPLPDNCLRGIPNNSYLNEGGTIGAHLFYFEGNDRGDGWLEQSVNWQDDDTVNRFTLNQTKADGTLQFRTGLAEIARVHIDQLNDRPLVRGLLSYERQPLPDNPYHGNILLRASTSKPTMKLIAAGLALAVSRVISP